MSSAETNSHTDASEESTGRLQNTESLVYPTRSLHFLKRLDAASSRADGYKAEPSSLKLNIIVVGGGLGGLSAAIALARKGHTVTVLEAAPELGEVGAGIQVPPNSSRLLLAWGIAPFLQGKAVETEAITLRRWRNGAKIGYTKLLPDFRESYDAPYWVVHRAHLLDALLQLALKHGVTVQTDARVLQYDPSKPSLTLHTGVEKTADLIVAADGVKSLARPAILTTPDTPPRYTRFAAYRATVSTQKMRADPRTAELLDRPGQNLWLGPQRHIMAYSIAAGETFNLVISHPATTDPATWRQDDNVAEMKRQFEGWDPRIVGVLDMVEQTTRWPLMAYRDALPRWVHRDGKMCMLGDAAHAMLPYMSQGAAMAVEDGAALAEAIGCVGRKEDMGRALGVWESVRLKRTSGMQQAAWVQGKLWHFEDGAEQRARDESMRAEVEGVHFVESANQWSDPVTQAWTYAYDAEMEVRVAFRE
ncbi:FAD/NAD(P)-binding domain-containing protein [Pseudovirgaria hyperparasitica]|uniref:FAD/NAD(P)-binding domain-containing protein n=1 Tax=Pseudovirgaria hyperparasitica TaxID=470096 RepID=A0A6A6VXS2_9PEZI|nr:FAD/NAD(P)-binding domain-containing protein [Pseudovirgaria hyperparasitica]KAF2755033.1 FAD/NAD(P)-binding domain-containing protein [Pseudovirgaria hyperparasitica]